MTNREELLMRVKGLRADAYADMDAGRDLTKVGVIVGISNLDLCNILERICRFGALEDWEVSEKEKIILRALVVRGFVEETTTSGPIERRDIVVWDIGASAEELIRHPIDPELGGWT